MRRKNPRGELPWPVAPIPAAPILSNELKVGEVLDRLNRWYGELDDWLHIWRKRRVTFYRRLPRIEEQIRHLLQCADKYLPEDAQDGLRFEKRLLLARYHELLARALSEAIDWEKDGEAYREFKLAMSLAPHVADYWYSYVRYLVECRRIVEALDEMNAVDLHIIQAKHKSIAQQILNWALAYPEIAFGIRADLIKHCIALVSRTRTGLLVQGCPLPHPTGMKWQRTEILRVLAAGTQCSLPLDELCRREGIDEDTYYRWRRRYLPPEWANAPPLD
jgi:hypothetical protein